MVYDIKALEVQVSTKIVKCFNILYFKHRMIFLNVMFSKYAQKLIPITVKLRYLEVSVSNFFFNPDHSVFDLRIKLFRYIKFS